MDDIDYDPDGGGDDVELSWDGHGKSPAPWTHLPSSHAVTITPVPETLTVNRTADSGGGTITATTPLSDGTTEMQVTVTGTDSNGNDNSSLSGTYTRPHSTAKYWNQVGGDGAIYRQATGGGFAWSFIDGSDGTPSFSINVAENVIVPWQVASSFASNNVTLSSVEKTITVNRFSDRKGASRPLLSKLVGGAAAAYSLRDLNDKAGNNKVVEVRRSSGGSRKFLAKELSNGTLEDWVTAPITGWNTPATFNDTPDGTATITSASSTATTSTVSFTGSGTIRVLPKSNYVTAEAGDQVVFNMSVSGLDSAMTFRLRKASSNTTVGTATVNNGDNQDVTLNLTASSGYTGGYPHFTADAGSGEATVTINSVTVTGKSGFVETWYDQSGNSNDAVQITSTEQPKIVNAGSLVRDSKGHPEIDFDGAESLSKTAFTQGDLVQANTIFSIAKLDVAADINRKVYDGTASTKRNMLFLSTDGSGEFGFFADDVISTGVTATNDKNLFSALFNGAASVLFINGASAASGDVGDYPMSGIMIGKNHSGNVNNWLGQIQEIVIYASDQSANRLAIEANINNQYDIY
jgi:hypothetical protein